LPTAPLTTPAATPRILASLVERVAWELEEYRKHGFKCLGVVGINRSPSCGVETTSMGGREVPGRGVFMLALEDELKRRGLVLEMAGIKASEAGEASKKINSLLGL
jgi:predicted secreted protein